MSCRTQLEIRMITEWDKIGFCPRVKVVDADHVVSLFQERATQVRSEKSGPSRNENPFAVKVFHARVASPPDSGIGKRWLGGIGGVDFHVIVGKIRRPESGIPWFVPQ